jgi:hypothetical protein
MSLLIHPHNFNACHLHFKPAVQNNDAVVGKFYHIIYSTKHVSFNGVGILVNLAGSQHDAHYNKVLVQFDPALPANKTVLSQLHAVECAIIDKHVSVMGGGACRRVHSLWDQLNSGSIRAHVNDRNDSANASANASANHVMLKICGVWETNDECGITHKFVKC